MSMTAGTLAEKTGLHIETVRYYEKRGLLPEPERNESGYRIYTAVSVRQLLFVKTAKGLGFTLHEIKELLDLSVRRGALCSEMHSRAESKLAVIDGKINMLIRMKNALEAFSGTCNGTHSVEDCHFVHNLWGTEGECNGT